jgi:peptidoglycan/LPS O-acetylase OafA/YrhL
MLGIVLLSCGFMSFSEVHGLEINRLLLYGVPSLALVYAAVSLEKQINFVHNYFARMFVNIGNASFSTYLSHFYVVEGTRKILCDELHLFDLYTPWGVMIALFMAVAVGQLLYEFIDRPLSRFCRSRLAAQ